MEEGKLVFEGKTAKGLDVKLRTLRSDDAPLLLDYINTLSAEKTYLLFQGEQLTLEEETQHLNRWLDAVNAGTGMHLLAMVDGAIAGETEITLGPKTMAHVGHFGLAIAKPFRGQGLGELLMESIINEAITHLPNMQYVYLRVYGNNAIAMSLYRKMGFVECGRLPGGVLHRGQYVDDVHMAKRVREAVTG